MGGDPASTSWLSGMSQGPHPAHTEGSGDGCLMLRARGAVPAAAAAGTSPSLPPLLLMNVGETCCAMTLISKENCKAFFFFLPYFFFLPPAEFSTECE